MSKEPSVEHEYHPKKDRFEITIKHYALKKKSDREALLKHILHRLERNPVITKATEKKARKGKLPKSSIKASRLIEVGD
ncbi:hypothetical protein [Bradyrhizobium sp.]|uniref:hypothetical protein n=1 Tax=Bradyrhizobium sp. TaxID=376 RepID=UPI0039E5DD25